MPRCSSTSRFRRSGFRTSRRYLFFGRALSYAQLEGAGRSAGRWLQSVGVKAGDRVAISCRNCPQFAVAYYGVQRANAVVVPRQPDEQGEEFQHFIADPQTKAVICSADLAAIVASANRRAARGAARACHPPHALCRRHAGGTIAPDDAPSPAIADWLRSDPAAAEGCTRWADALALNLVPGPQTAQPTISRCCLTPRARPVRPRAAMHTHRTLMANCCGGGQWSHASAET